MLEEQLTGLFNVTPPVDPTETMPENRQSQPTNRLLPIEAEERKTSVCFTERPPSVIAEPQQESEDPKNVFETTESCDPNEAEDEPETEPLISTEDPVLIPPVTLRLFVKTGTSIDVSILATLDFKIPPNVPS